MRRLRLSLLVVVVLGGTGAPGRAAPARLDHAEAPTSQAITLQVDPDQPGYRGAVHIEVAVQAPSAALRLHAAMPIDRLSLRGPAGPVPVRHEQTDAELTVRGPGPLAPGAYALDIEFHQLLGTQGVGLYRTSKDGRGYAFTQFEAADARRAFPCWDEPDFKIPYQLTVSIPRNLEAVSNTPIASQREDGATKTIVFQRTRPLPSYLLALAVGPFDFVPIPGLSVPGRVVTPRGLGALAARAIAVTPPILRALERYFDGPCPYEKLDLIAVPSLWPLAMENPGAVTFREHLLLYDARRETPEQQAWLVSVIAHELSHLWFGDLVTMRWWDDLWLNEAFATWMGRKIAAELLPQHELPVDAVRSAQRIMVQDARPTTTAVRQAVDRPDDAMNRIDLAYTKGPAVLVMFERWLGEDRFRAGVNAYLRAHADGNVSAADLWAAMPRAAGDLDGAGALATFIGQPGLPLIDVEILPHGRVRLSQQRFRTAGVSTAEAVEQRWQVPVALKFSDGRITATRTVLLREPSQVFPLTRGTLSFVFPLSQGTGYYRFRLPEAQLKALSQRAGAVLDPAERVALIGNLGALLDAGVLPADELLRALPRLADDPHPHVLSAVLQVLTDVNEALVTEELRAPFAAYLRRLLGPVRRRMGLAPQPGPGEEPLVTMMRPWLVSWLGHHAEDEEVLALARERAGALLADPKPEEESLASTWLSLAAAKHGDRALFDQVRERLKTAAPAEWGRLVMALGRFRDPMLRAEARGIGFALRLDDLLLLPSLQTAVPAQRDSVFTWVMQSYPALKKRLPEAALARLPYLAGGCDEALAQRAQDFLGANAVPGTTEALAEMRQQVRDCTALRRREGAAAARFLQSDGL